MRTYLSLLAALVASSAFIVGAVEDAVEDAGGDAFIADASASSSCRSPEVSMYSTRV